MQSLTQGIIIVLASIFAVIFVAVLMVGTALMVISGRIARVEERAEAEEAAQQRLRLEQKFMEATNFEPINPDAWDFEKNAPRR